MSVVCALLFFVALSQAQHTFFPPAVKYVNSDFKQVALNWPTSTGHLDSFNDTFHVTFHLSHGLNFDEWGQLPSTKWTMYVLGSDGGTVFFCSHPLPIRPSCFLSYSSFIDCIKSVTPNPYNCTGWTQTGEDEYTQKCYQGEDFMTLQSKVENEQPAWVSASTVMAGTHMSTNFTFFTTDAQPPAASVFVPPHSCKTSKRRSEVNTIAAFLFRG
eukprot:TRINITY_DN2369_c0_g1_i2.p1 TRINITY_DN2369_c0_g1~~TRINITY_DN2369_c0_g1_i2.p1  ORF type:complete len:224 (-),score=26.37 TRINITY_DN2369_c0_g1_i2:181-822(-)